MSNKILLIHGWGVTHQIFNNLVINLPEYEVIAPDLPGYGDNTNFHGHFNIEEIADSFLNAIGDIPVHLLGWSMGGVISMIMAAKSPKKIKTLTLVSSFAKYLKDDTYPHGIEKDSLTDFYELLNEDYNKYIKHFIEFQARSANISKTENDLQNISNNMRINGEDILLKSLKAAMGIDIRNYLKDILVPTLIVYGKKDMLTPYSMQEYLYSNIKNSELVCFENSYHASFLSEQDLFIYILKNFYIKNE